MKQDRKSTPAFKNMPWTPCKCHTVLLQASREKLVVWLPFAAWLLETSGLDYSLVALRADIYERLRELIPCRIPRCLQPEALHSLASLCEPGGMLTPACQLACNSHWQYEPRPKRLGLDVLPCFNFQHKIKPLLPMQNTATQQSHTPGAIFVAAVAPDGGVIVGDPQQSHNNHTFKSRFPSP